MRIYKRHHCIHITEPSYLVAHLHKEQLDRAWHGICEIFLLLPRDLALDPRQHFAYRQHTERSNNR